MGFLKAIAKKVATKMAKVDPTDNMTQINTEDIISVIKELFL